MMYSEFVYYIYMYAVYSCQQTQLNKVSKELVEIKDSTSVLRKRLAEMMNSLLSDLVSGCTLYVETCTEMC